MYDESDEDWERIEDAVKAAEDVFVVRAGDEDDEGESRPESTFTAFN